MAGADGFVTTLAREDNPEECFQVSVLFLTPSQYALVAVVPAADAALVLEGGIFRRVVEVDWG